MDSLVSADWLARHLNEADVVVLDASWHLPSTGRSGRDEYLARHIAGARFFDIDALSDRSNPAPHMLPSAKDFGVAMERLGVGRSDRIVIYDDSPLRTAARAWFMLRHFGALDVAILDGGFQQWLAEQRPVDSREPAPRQARFDAVVRSGEIVDKRQILEGPACALVDARGNARFEGKEAEPRPGVASGHIPGAKNLPFALLYDSNGRFRPADELRQLFVDRGLDPDHPFIATCGSGVTAASLIFAAQLFGNADGQLYDGSWSEWGADPATPKATGPA